MQHELVEHLPEVQQFWQKVLIVLRPEKGGEGKRGEGNLHQFSPCPLLDILVSLAANINKVKLLGRRQVGKAGFGPAIPRFESSAPVVADTNQSYSVAPA